MKRRRLKLIGLTGGGASEDGEFVGLEVSIGGMGAAVIEMPFEAVGDILAALLVMAERAAVLRGGPDHISLSRKLQVREVQRIELAIADTRAHLALRLYTAPGTFLSVLLSPERAHELAEAAPGAIAELRRLSS